MHTCTLPFHFKLCTIGSPILQLSALGDGPRELLDFLVYYSQVCL